MEKTLHSNQYKKFLTELRLARERLGVSQEVLAAALDVKQTFISRCERGERRLDVIEVRRWCKALGIELEDFAKQIDEVLKDSDDEAVRNFASEV